MLFSMVWVLAGVTAWLVASLALALIVGPMLRRPDRVELATSGREPGGLPLTPQR